MPFFITISLERNALFGTKTRPPTLYDYNDIHNNFAEKEKRCNLIIPDPAGIIPANKERTGATKAAMSGSLSQPDFSANCLRRTRQRDDAGRTPLYLSKILPSNRYCEDNGHTFCGIVIKTSGRVEWRQ